MQYIRKERQTLKKSITLLAVCALFFAFLVGCSAIFRDANNVSALVKAEASPSILHAEGPLQEYSSALPNTSDTVDILESPVSLAEDGVYISKDDVALYIHLYGKLPSNYITKKQAQQLGWSGGSLDQFAPGKCIGGDKFGNYEGLLPSKNGRVYTECDIDTLEATSRGAKRIVFSNDGLIYYTDNHYESFTLLYGDAGD